MNKIFITMDEDTESECSQSLLQIPRVSINNSHENLPTNYIWVEGLEEESPSLLRGRDENEKVAWIEPATKLLMSLVQEYKPKLGKSLKLKTKKKMWEAITEVMRNYGYIYSATQVENKFKSLERSFKNKLIHNKKTGRDRASCSYEKELNDVFKGRDHIFPQYILGSAGDGTTQKELQEQAGIKELPTEKEHEVEENISSAVEENDEFSKFKSSSPSRSPDCGNKKPNKSIVRELSLLRREKQEYNAKKINYQDQKLKAYEDRTKEIAEKNSLLKELINVFSKKE